MPTDDYVCLLPVILINLSLGCRLIKQMCFRATWLWGGGESSVLLGVSATLTDAATVGMVLSIIFKYMVAAPPISQSAASRRAQLK